MSVVTILSDSETDHIVVLGEEEFTVRHPLSERVAGDLFKCYFHPWLSSQDGPPHPLGKYRVADVDGEWELLMSTAYPVA
jgi:hypothetical protein